MSEPPRQSASCSHDEPAPILFVNGGGRPVRPCLVPSVVGTKVETEHGKYIHSWRGTVWAKGRSPPIKIMGREHLFRTQTTPKTSKSTEHITSQKFSRGIAPDPHTREDALSPDRSPSARRSWPRIIVRTLLEIVTCSRNSITTFSKSANLSERISRKAVQLQQRLEVGTDLSTKYSQHVVTFILFCDATRCLRFGGFPPTLRPL